MLCRLSGTHSIGQPGLGSQRPTHLCLPSEGIKGMSGATTTGWVQSLWLLIEWWTRQQFRKLEALWLNVSRWGQKDQGEGTAAPPPASCWYFRLLFFCLEVTLTFYLLCARPAHVYFLDPIYWHLQLSPHFISFCSCLIKVMFMVLFWSSAQWARCQLL